jgi:hypothetical protein
MALHGCLAASPCRRDAGDSATVETGNDPMTDLEAVSVFYEELDPRRDASIVEGSDAFDATAALKRNAKRPHLRHVTIMRLEAHRPRMPVARATHPVAADRATGH